MLAGELAERVPMVTMATTGAEAARVVAGYRLSAVVVADEQGVPVQVIPGSQLLGLILPQFVRDDPKLAHAYDVEGAQELCRRLNDSTIGELLDSDRLSGAEPPSVLPEDTLVEVAAAMSDAHSPAILVRDRDGTFHGVVTMSRALAAIALAAGQQSPLITRRLEQDLGPEKDLGG